MTVVFDMTGTKKKLKKRKNGVKKGVNVAKIGEEIAFHFVPNGPKKAFFTSLIRVRVCICRPYPIKNIIQLYGEVV